MSKIILMTTKDKVLECIYNAVIWAVLYLMVEGLTEDGYTISDTMYWFGAIIGYSLAIFTNKIVKKTSILKPHTDEDIIDNSDYLDSNKNHY